MSKKLRVHLVVAVRDGCDTYDVECGRSRWDLNTSRETYVMKKTTCLACIKAYAARHMEKVYEADAQAADVRWNDAGGTLVE